MFRAISVVLLFAALVSGFSVGGDVPVDAASARATRFDASETPRTHDDRSHPRPSSLRLHRVRERGREPTVAVEDASFLAVIARLRERQGEGCQAELRGYSDELAAMGRSAVPSLVALLDDKDVGGWALRSLRLMGPEAAAAVPDVAALLTSREDPSPVAEALRALGPDGVDRLLAAAVQDSNPRLRVAALHELRCVDDERVALAMVSACKSPATEVRRAALDAMYVRGEVAVPAIVEALSDVDADVRWCAADAARRFAASSAPAVPGLVALLKECDAMKDPGGDGVNSTAIDALVAIGDQADEALRFASYSEDRRQADGARIARARIFDR